MSVVRSYPPLSRPEIVHLMDAAQLVRRATRHCVDLRDEAAGSVSIIDAAIGELVAARLIITAAEAAPSKDL